jgi:tRNA A-37 threonylcarbamoyl transferase component Bud32
MPPLIPIGRRISAGPGWVHRVTRTASGARLDVHHRTGDDRWVAIAAAYWDGLLPGLRGVASSRFAIVHRGRVSGDDGACFFKRFLLRGWRDWLKHWVRSSRARRALVRGEQVRALGFDAPRALCLIEERRRGGVGPTALVSEAIEGARSMREWVHEPAGDEAGALAERRRVLRAFGRAIGAWHAAGLFHGDMSPRNILARREEGRLHCFWLDNEGVRRFARLPMRLRVRNLIQVNKRLHALTRTDRMRLARGYFDEVPLPRSRQKAVLRRVARVRPPVASPRAAAVAAVRS